jgi:hypothetical protein
MCYIKPFTCIYHALILFTCHGRSSFVMLVLNSPLFEIRALDRRDERYPYKDDKTKVASCSKTVLHKYAISHGISRYFSLPLPLSLPFDIIIFCFLISNSKMFPHCEPQIRPSSKLAKVCRTDRCISLVLACSWYPEAADTTACESLVQ